VSETRDERLLVGLLEGKTAKDAAEAAGYSERTARRRLGDSGFRTRLDEAREEMFAAATARLAGAPDVAITTLLEIAQDKDAPATARVNAADKLLGRALEFGLGRDVGTRLTKVEELLEAVRGRAAA
jgi:hypothetical protein